MSAIRLCLPLLLAACAVSEWDTGFVTVKYAGREHKVGIKGDMVRVEGGFEATLRDGDYLVTIGVPRKMDELRSYPLTQSNVRLIVAHPGFNGGEPVDFKDGAITVHLWDPEVPPQVRGVYKAQHKAGKSTIQIAGSFRLYVSRWE